MVSRKRRVRVGPGRVDTSPQPRDGWEDDRRWGWVWTLVVTVLVASAFGLVALRDDIDSRGCTSQRGQPDRIGGTYDDLFLVCRDRQGRITEVYAHEGGKAPEEARCAADGGVLYQNRSRWDTTMMCIVDGQMAWWVNR